MCTCHCEHASFVGSFYASCFVVVVLFLNRSCLIYYMNEALLKTTTLLLLSISSLVIRQIETRTSC